MQPFKFGAAMGRLKQSMYPASAYMSYAGSGTKPPGVPTPGAAPSGINAQQSALRLARENNIDINSVRGTGEGGRIMGSDIRRRMAGLPQPTPPVAAPPSTPTAPTPPDSIASPLQRFVMAHRPLHTPPAPTPSATPTSTPAGATTPPDSIASPLQRFVMAHRPLHTPPAPTPSATPTSTPATPAGATTPNAQASAIRIAKQYGIDINSLKGSGPGGQIMRSDVMTAVREKGGSANMSSARKFGLMLKLAGPDENTNFPVVRATTGENSLMYPTAWYGAAAGVPAGAVVGGLYGLLNSKKDRLRSALVNALRGGVIGGAAGAGAGFGGFLGGAGGFDIGNMIGRKPGGNNEPNGTGVAMGLSGAGAGTLGGGIGSAMLANSALNALGVKDDDDDNKEDKNMNSKNAAAFNFGAHIAHLMSKEAVNPKSVLSAARQAARPMPRPTTQLPTRVVGNGTIVNPNPRGVTTAKPSWIRHNEAVGRGLDPATGLKPGAIAPSPPAPVPPPTRPSGLPGTGRGVPGDAYVPAANEVTTGPLAGLDAPQTGGLRGGATNRVSVSPAEAAAGQAKVTITPKDVAKVRTPATPNKVTITNDDLTLDPTIHAFAGPGMQAAPPRATPRDNQSSRVMSLLRSTGLRSY